MTIQPEPRLARCSCGQLQILCSGDPDKVSVCHCLECQRRTGSAFGVAAFFQRQLVVISGNSKVFIRIGESGKPLAHHFCIDCGTTVFWYPAVKPNHVAVALGCFENPTFPAPHQAVHEHTRHPWVRLDVAGR